MKRMITTVLLLMIVFSLTATNVSAKTSSSQQDFVKMFILDVLCKDEKICDMDLKDVKLSKEKIYDIYLLDIGYVYEFSMKHNSFEGFIVIDRNRIENEWEYSIKEINFDMPSPYNEKNSKNIYLGYGQYFEKDKDTLVNTISGNEYEYQDIMSYIDDNFELVFPSGGGITTDIYDPYSFMSMDVTESLTSYEYPLMNTNMKYTGQYNNCSPTAGVSIALYLDRIHANLVEGVNPTAVIDGVSRYKDYEYFEEIYYPPYSIELSFVRALHDTFYNDMETNSYITMVPGYTAMNTGVGTVPNKFYNVLDDYFESKGLTLHHVDIIESAESVWGYIGESMTGSKWTLYKNQIDLGRPVVIQLGVDWSVDYTLIRYESYFNETSTSVNYHYWEYEFMSAHTVVGYGYRTHEFYQPHPFYGYPILSRIDNFLVVANGWGGTSYINTADDDIGMAYSIYPTS